jgi:pteridine reductase
MEHDPLTNNELAGKTALITGAARRIGAAIAVCLHAAGMNLVLHYRSSATAAEQLCDELQQQRPDSVELIQGDLLNTAQLPSIVTQARARWGRLDALINNASSYYATPLESVSEADWNDLVGSNLKAPFFLAQAAAPWLRETGGSIINMVDIHAERPRDRHPVYSIAKAGLVMLTKSLAWELRPHVRVNAVAPGAILWATAETDPQQRSDILARVPLQRLGEVEDIARSVLFLLRDGDYINGQVIAVDGGRSLFM